MRSVALDVGKEKLVLCEVRDGAVVKRARGRSLADLREVLGAGTPPARVAFEACRQGWWLHDQLTQWGHTPIMLDTTRIRSLGVGHHRRKNDPIDAEAIARALERGYVHAAHVLSPHRREIRSQLTIRHGLIETRTRFINILRGLAVSEGLTVRACGAEHFVSHARAAAWSAAMKPQIEPMLASLEQLEGAIRDATESLHALCAKEPLITRLATVPFVGLICAATFVAVLDDAGRFRDAHALQSYLGLVPSENTSNTPPRLGSITKAGNRWARTMLVQSAWLMLTKGDADDGLVVWAREIQQRRNKYIAAVALARRLAGVLWALWRRDAIYDARRAHAARPDTPSRAEALVAATKKLRASVPKPRRSAHAATANAPKIRSRKEVKTAHA